MKENKRWIFVVREACLWLLLVMGGTHVCQADGRSQAGTIDMQVKNLSLSSVLRQIERLSGYTFVFKSEDVAPVRAITLDVKNEPVSAVLEKCLRETGLSYLLRDNLIIIRKHPQAADVTRIQGVVKDRTGVPLPGVNVRIKGSTVGVATDKDGRFKLDLAPRPNLVLIFSFIGMQTVEMVSKEMMEVTLDDETITLKEAVVTGIFNKSKESFTGAVSVITSEDIMNHGSRNLLQTLGNIDPAFNLLSDNFAGSNPNNIPNVQIRGASSLPSNIDDLKEEKRDRINTPLILLDGFEISLSRMLDLDEHRVESVVLLKDASAAAFHGSRAANGVVVITTKKPQAGSLLVSYNGKYAAEVPDLTEYRLLNARDKLDLEYRSGMYFYDKVKELEVQLLDFYAKLLLDANRGVETYWLSRPLRVAIPHRHNLSFEGGSENFRYNMSLNYDRRNGVMIHSFREVISGDVALSYAGKNLLVQNTLTIGLTNTKESNYGEFSLYAQANPYQRIYDEKGDMYREFPTADLGEMAGFYVLLYPQYNPLYDARIKTRNTGNRDYWSNNLYVDWRPVEEMNVRARVGIEKGRDETHRFFPANHSLFANYTGEDVLRKGRYDYTSGHSFDYNADVTFSFNKRLGEKHLLFTGLNASVKQQRSEGVAITAEGFPDEDIYHLSSAMSYLKDGQPSGWETINRNLGFLANVNYNYDGRYYLDATLRKDGNSAFGASRRWGSFWSVGLGWNLHEEKFFQWNHVVNYLKIRGSYGLTGMQGFNPYDAMMVYIHLRGDRYGNNIGAILLRLGNKDLKWQTTGKANVGIEFSLFHNRIQGVLDLYREKTDDMVTQLELPLSNGFKNYIENFGSLENRGWELKTTIALLRNTAKGLSWHATVSMGSNRNKILEISQSLKDQNRLILSNTDGRNPNFLFEEGKSMRTIYAVPSLGISPSNGKELFRDRFGNVTDEWDARDQVDCGVAEPKLQGVLNTSFRWKELIVNASFAYSLGTSVYNTTFRDKVEVQNYTYNVDRRVYDDRWKEPGDVVRFKSLMDKTKTNATSRFIQKENMFRFNSISLRYELGNLAWIQREMRTKHLIVGFETVDLLYLSSIKRERGINYPFARTFSLSLSAVY
ncbi:MAG: SusC/RagA family TonB-linked outer membrane protein [Odoribacteraceae bacterium]|jgi:TonB-linked SusC/RagA family outer membrane protein|nr:SusC/RagA family TonB-linked outer membrane protein [Odoribacteraceae bacterium]